MIKELTDGLIEINKGIIIKLLMEVDRPGIDKLIE